MKDQDKPISKSDRELVVGVSIVVGISAGFLVFFTAMAIGATSTAGTPNRDIFVVFLFAAFFGLITLAIVPFAYQKLGRICALQLDRTREETYKDTIPKWTKSEVIRKSTVSPFTIGPSHLWYFGIQYFDEQWSEKNIEESACPTKTAPQSF
jgi:hypothetical protein